MQANQYIKDHTGISKSVGILHKRQLHAFYIFDLFKKFV